MDRMKLKKSEIKEATFVASLLLFKYLYTLAY